MERIARGPPRNKFPLARVTVSIRGTGSEMEYIPWMEWQGYAAPASVYQKARCDVDRVVPTSPGCDACAMPACVILALDRLLLIIARPPQLGAVTFNMILQHFMNAATPWRRSLIFIDRRRSLSTTLPSHPRWHKFARRSTYAAVTLGTLWFIDQEFNASAVRRNFRTVWTVSVSLVCESAAQNW